MTVLPPRYTAMALTQAGDPTLHAIERDLPAPGPGQLLLRVQVCPLPLVGLSKPSNNLIVVVLPAPLGPRKAKIDFCGTRRLSD